MALNFPINPQENDVYTSEGTTWQYDGTTWNIVSATSALSIPSTPNVFGTVSVTGQQDVVAESSTDTLTFVAGDNITITTDETTDSITINGQAGGGGEQILQNLFATLAVTNGPSLTAGSPTDTFSFAAGTNVTLGLDTNSKTLTINSTAAGGGGVTTYAALEDTGDLTPDHTAYGAIATYITRNVATRAYEFLYHYEGSENPTIYAISGTTIAFKLDCPGHPFQIQDPTGDPYNSGLIHVATNGTETTGINAQNKTDGTLYWNIPQNISGTYRYQCTVHSAMVGGINIKNIIAI